MNCYTLAAKIMKKAEKARRDQEDWLEKVGAHQSEWSPEDVFDATIRNEVSRFDRTCDLACDLLSRFQRKIALQNETNGERWYFITVRPPELTNWIDFKYDVEHFWSKWQSKWLEGVYVFEQKGENESELGKGFHWHARICTSTINYYKSHVLRDLKRTFHYVAPNCIKVEAIKSLERCIEYMQGDKKSDAKKPAVLMDSVWRERLGLPAEVKYVSRQEDLVIDEASSGVVSGELNLISNAVISDC